MFVIIVAGAIYARSAALLSDSLDNLGDALTYALSLYAVGLGSVQKARVAFFKGILIFIAALVVAGQIGYRLIYPNVPVFEAMGAFSLLGLLANGACLALLWRHRNEDVNMSSVWECSKNDIASNVAVFVTAGAVWATGAAWPDLLVALCLVLLFLRSAFKVLRSARAELRLAPTRVPAAVSTVILQRTDRTLAGPISLNAKPTGGIPDGIVADGPTRTLK